MISSSDLSPVGLTGRAAETAAIRRAIGQSRLVTVTGLPGVGKSAVAVAAATARTVGAHRAGRFSDGAYLIRLDTLQDEVLLPHTIAAALLLPDAFRASPLEALIGQLQNKHLLLLLDTCEHLVGACAAIAAALRQACPGVCILATSREPLRVPGEQTIAVRPLLLDDAVQLFGQLAPRGAAASSPPRGAAASSQPRGAAASSQQSLVRAACAKLDGLPLAISMAARQLTHRSLDALLAELDAGYDCLADPEAAVWRHQTLQAAIGWSHQLCTPAERLLWARLAVFDLPFCIKDCQEVCATAQLSEDAIAVGVTMLTERSILLPESGEPSQFVMPATIRAYGLAMLSRLAEDEEIRQQYRRWRGGPRRDAAWH